MIESQKKLRLLIPSSRQWQGTVLEAAPSASMFLKVRSRSRAAGHEKNREGAKSPGNRYNMMLQKLPRVGGRAGPPSAHVPVHTNDAHPSRKCADEITQEAVKVTSHCVSGSTPVPRRVSLPAPAPPPQALDQAPCLGLDSTSCKN